MQADVKAQERTAYPGKGEAATRISGSTSNHAKLSIRLHACHHQQEAGVSGGRTIIQNTEQMPS